MWVVHWGSLGEAFCECMELLYSVLYELMERITLLVGKGSQIDDALLVRQRWQAQDE